MKRKNVQLGKKLILSKATVSNLSDDQQMRIEGGVSRSGDICLTQAQSCWQTQCYTQQCGVCPSAGPFTAPCVCV